MAMHYLLRSLTLVAATVGAISQVNPALEALRKNPSSVKSVAVAGPLPRVVAATVVPVAAPAFSWVDPQGEPASPAIRLRAALGGLATHGLDADYYRDAFDQVGRREPAKRGVAYQALLNGILLDLRDGVSRDRRGDAGRLAAIAPLRIAAEERLGNNESLDTLFRTTAARHPAYPAMQAALAEYRLLAEAGLPTIPQGAKLKPGGSDPRVPAIRAWLIETGQADAELVEDRAPVAAAAAMGLSAPMPVPSQRYDEPLVDAVKAFQQRHGLEADGVIGKGTIDAMNIPPAERVAQLALNLERLRRLPALPADYVHVNIPGFRLHAYRGGEETLAMKVIVGQRATPTPEFTNAITSLVVNPTWTPTYKILRDEMLPKARRNPGSLAGYTVRDSRTGETLNASAVDWHSVSAGDVSVVQPAGRGNALGKVKFLMPASDSIYLHDTARPQLFSQSARALSHGCIRLEKPKALLEALFAMQRDDGLARAEKAYGGSASQSFRMGAPVPVYATYLTAFVGDDGRAVFYPDVYGKDKAMAKRYAAMIPRPADEAPQQLASR